MAAPSSMQQRPKHLKRDSSHFTSATSALSLTSPKAVQDPSPLAKRPRVEFSPLDEIRILNEDASTRPQELVAEEVFLALDGHRRARETGQSGNATYEALRGLFLSAGLDRRDANRDHDDGDADGKTTSGPLLKQYIVALTRRVGDLKTCASLVYAVLDINWFGRDEQFVTIYTRFLGALAAVAPGFLRTIMEKTVRHLVALPSYYGRLSGESIVRKRQMLANLHGLLRYLTTLLPAAAAALKDALQSQFPNYRMTSRKDFLAYIRSLFRIASYVPQIESDILALVTERLVKLDVEIQEELEDLEEDVEGELADGPGKKEDNYFLDDDTSDSSDAESDMSSDPDEDPEERQLRTLKEKTSKLDAGMDFLFTYYNNRVLKDGHLHELDPLISLFTTFILPTYRSRHVQFLTFHFAQLDPQKCAHFLSRLLTLSSSASLSTAKSGSAYLASFLARGACIPRTLVRDVTGVLISRIDALRGAAERTCQGPDIGRYAPFYASVQALLYVFCFRWRELLFNSSLCSGTLDEDLDYQVTGETLALHGLRDCLMQTIYSRLNPLKVCAPAIVKQFAAIANHLRYVFVYPLLETNKRVKLSSFRTYGVSGGAVAARDSALSLKGGEAHHQLDAFFPFDPYRLTRSGRWLGGDYVEWRGIAGLQGPGRIEPEEEVEDEDDSDGEEGSSGEEDEDEVLEELDSDSS